MSERARDAVAKLDADMFQLAVEAGLHGSPFGVDLPEAKARRARYGVEDDYSNIEQTLKILAGARERRLRQDLVRLGVL